MDERADAADHRALAALTTGASAQVSGLNDLGAVVGSSGDAENPTEHVGVVWPRGTSRATKLAVPPGTTNPNYSAGDINDLGQIIGVNSTPDDGIQAAIRWRSATAPATLLKPGAYAAPTAISDTGQVLIDEFRPSPAGGVQRWAVAWRNGQLVDLGAGLAIAQNLRGQVTVNLNQNPRTGPVTAALVTVRW